MGLPQVGFPPASAFRPPGPGQTSPVSSLAAGANAFGGAIRPLQPRREILARVNSTGTARASVTVAARILNPAARMICGFSIAFEPDQQQDPATFSSSVWSARAVRPNAESGREALLHEIFSNESLPDLYEVQTAVRSILVTATLFIPLTAGAVAIPGNWVIEATWEPGITMCDSEAVALYAQTDVKVALRGAGALAPP